MRNTRVLLGAATFVLAIAGAISTMGTSRNLAAKVFTVGQRVCTAFTTTCNVGFAKTCTTGTALHRIVWTAASNCINKFKRP